MEAKRWIWEDDRFPAFPFDRSRIEPQLQRIAYLRGVLDGVLAVANDAEVDEIEISSLTDEIVSSSEIEGEYLQRESVRDSIAMAINRDLVSAASATTHHTDNLAALILDSSRNPAPMSLTRLHGWHNALFEGAGGYGGIQMIRRAVFRDYDDMKVVENRFGRAGTVVKYVAPPHDRIADTIAQLIDYCNHDPEDPAIKSAIAHLWFVAVHPYDDGNGRIARTLADRLLYGEGSQALFSVSTSIVQHHSAYYALLDRTTDLHKNRHYDFTPWIAWNLTMLIGALEATYERVRLIIRKVKFRDRCREGALTEAQREFLEVFVGALRPEGPWTFGNADYRTITHTSPVTASRQIRKLLDQGCIQVVEGSGGRSRVYEVVL